MNTLYAIAREVDCWGNGLLAGNPRQTISARAYEGGVLKGLWQWSIAYWAIDATAYALRWLFARPLGYHWGEDMPVNHCKDAFDAHPTVRTYA